MERTFPKQWKGPLHMWKNLLKGHHKWIGCLWWSQETLLQKRNKVVLRKTLMQKRNKIDEALQMMKLEERLQTLKNLKTIHMLQTNEKEQNKCKHMALQQIDDDK